MDSKLAEHRGSHGAVSGRGEVGQAIEECRDAEEARALVATYDRLIAELCSQLRA
jgi:hypothetical protein